MLQSFRQADFNELAGLWESFFPKRYRVDPELLRLNTVDSPTFDWGASLIDMPDGKARGFVVVKKSPSGVLYPGSKQDCAYLCALVFNQPQIGIDLLAAAKHILYNRGVQYLHFGQDAWHFFPGCPMDCKKLTNLLMVEGFAMGREFFDMERELGDYKNTFPTPDDADLRTLEDGDLAGLYSFLDREFAGRWCYDTEQKIKSEGKPGTVFGLFVKDKLEGFARLQTFQDKLKMAGACWHLDLGERWGSLGPIGISERLRGKGYGHALLGTALEHLKSLGVQRCIIDWTDKVEFYAKHGFETAREYNSMSLNMETLPTQHTMTDVGLL
jgi:GNAT superfamily N-acetyltransferase